MNRHVATRGVEASRAHDSESLLPQAAASDGCRFKSDLGLSYDAPSQKAKPLFFS